MILEGFQQLLSHNTLRNFWQQRLARTNHNPVPINSASNWFLPTVAAKSWVVLRSFNQPKQLGDRYFSLGKNSIQARILKPFIVQVAFQNSLGKNSIHSGYPKSIHCFKSHFKIEILEFNSKDFKAKKKLQKPPV